MKIAVYNIFLTVWVLFFLGMGCFLSYRGIIRIDYKMEGAAIFFLIAFVLLVVFVFLYVVYKQRIVLIYRRKIISISVFSGKKTSIAFNNIKKINCGYFEQKAVYYLSLEVIGADGSIIAISDFEFENFKSIAKSVLQNTRYKIPQQLLLDQAKANKMANIWALVVLLTMLAFIIYVAKNQEFGWFLMVMTLGLVLLLFATVRRLIRYYRI